MLNHFETLCNLCASSGDESEVRNYILSVLRERKDVTWEIDPLGSLLVQKQGKKRAPHKLMISAHMDEVGMIVEGVYSAKAAIRLAQKYQVELPIIEQVNKILFEDKKAADALNDLMLRDPKTESDAGSWK